MQIRASNFLVSRSYLVLADESMLKGLVTTGAPKTPQNPASIRQSPQMGGLKVLPVLAPPPSRYRQDWEELEFLVCVL